jgi:hypothetical protein
MDSAPHSAPAGIGSTFFSYCHTDRPVVRLLAQFLEATGLRVLWDGALQPGQLWEDILLDWLDEADMAFVFWSSNAVDSKWVKTEVELLISKRSHRLVPVLLDQTTLPKGLRERQWIEMGSVLQRWIEGQPEGVAYSPVDANQVGSSLQRYLTGESDPGLLLTLDTFDLRYVLTEEGTVDPRSTVAAFVAWHEEPRLQRVLASREASLGPDHPDTADSLTELAQLYNYLRRFDQAETLMRRALQIREESLGEDHPDVVESLNSLARLHHIQGKFDRAEPFLKRAFTICQEALGPDHPYTVVVRENYANLLRQMGRVGEADAL